ncbi:hypothetical protein R2571_006824 [Pseudomonas aeruginosa]|nr:hypothetical protein [Pseudomonas aeruginosa]
MMLLLEWVGAICGVLGALIIASNTRLSPWGWWLFLLSSVSLCGYAVLAQAWGLLLLNCCFVFTNLTGLVRWWLPSLRQS